jgi:hypothetical protein
MVEGATEYQREEFQYVNDAVRFTADVRAGLLFPIVFPTCDSGRYISLRMSFAFGDKSLRRFASDQDLIVACAIFFPRRRAGTSTDTYQLPLASLWIRARANPVQTLILQSQ